MINIFRHNALRSGTEVAMSTWDKRDEKDGKWSGKNSEHTTFKSATALVFPSHPCLGSNPCFNRSTLFLLPLIVML